MSAPPIFRYAERRPGDELLPWIRNFWMFEVGAEAPPLHHVPPDGCTALVMHLTGPPGPGLLASGPWLAPLTVPVQPGDRFGGVRLQPGAAPILFGVSPVELRNRAQLAAPMLGSIATDIERALRAADEIDTLAAEVGTVLATHLREMRHPDQLVTHVAARLAENGDLSPSVLARELAVSDRTLRRRFGAGTGISPKQFARIRRFIKAAWGIADEERTWSEVAHGVGYADQPHLNRDVTDLTGLTPGALRRRIRSTRHDDVMP